MSTSITLKFFVTLLMVRHQGLMDYTMFCFESFSLSTLLFFAVIPIKKNPKDATVSDQAGSIL